MPLININHAATCDDSVKAAIMRDVTTAYASATGCDPSKVWVIIEEVDRSNWATGGISLAARDVAAKA